MNKEENKGITLVALVITIIILLILAGISIITLTKNNLFESAKLSKKTFENSEQLENKTLNEFEDTVNEYITGTSRNINIKLDYSNAFNPFEGEGYIQPTEYVATCDGLLMLPIQLWSGGSIEILINNKVSLFEYGDDSSRYLTLPLTKGDTVKFTYAKNSRIHNAKQCWMIPNK